MVKITGLGFHLLVLLLLFGCSAASHPSNNNTQIPSSSPDAGGSSVTPSPSPTASPISVSPVPTSSEQTVVNLDVGKLKAVFGFADREGKQLLVTGQDEGEEKIMALLDRAIGENSSVLSVKFVKWQQGDEESSSGRDTAQNFKNIPGYLFTVLEGKAVTDQTYYLADSRDFNTQSLLPIQPTNAEKGSANVDEETKMGISLAQKRGIKQIWKFADIFDHKQLYLVQFVKEGKEMLFSFVLKEGNQLAFMNYPAVAQDEYSVWRIDDGGQISPDMFSVLFAARTSKGMVLGLNWWGAEGVNSFLLKQVQNSFEEMNIDYSRYTSPL